MYLKRIDECIAEIEKLDYCSVDNQKCFGCGERMDCSLYKEWLESQSERELEVLASIRMHRKWDAASIAECDAERRHEYGPLDPPDENGYQQPMYPTTLYLAGKELDELNSELKKLGIDTRIMTSDELRYNWAIRDYEAWMDREPVCWEDVQKAIRQPDDDMPF